MIREELLKTIAMRATKTGLSDRALSVRATGSTDTVRNIRRGACPRIDTVEALFAVLGMRIEIIKIDSENPNQIKINSENQVCGVADVAVKDSRLAEIMSLLVAEWEASDARGQAHLVTRFHAYFPELGGKLRANQPISKLE